MGQFESHPQRGVAMTLDGSYRATVYLPEARFETDWADSCVPLPQEGVEVLVVFVNGDMNRPVIVQRFPTAAELASGGAGV